MDDRVNDVHPPDRTLDPEDWARLRELGQQMVADLIDDLQGLRDRPVWQAVPEEVRAHLRTDVPVEPQGPEAAYAEFRRYVQPYPRGNNHPRFWGWVNGSGLPMGILADLLSSAMNPSVGTFENAASLVEEQVLAWLKQMLGFDADTSAVLTSGCSMSNIIGLAVARAAKARFDVRKRGLMGGERPMVLYCSTEAHSSIQRAVELLGLGSDALRRIPVGPDYRMTVDGLRGAIRADRERGLHPFCVVASAGTVNTGTVDDLAALADLCVEEDCWLHVDGAFAALAWVCPELRPALRGLQRADSLAFDLHKWMYLPYDVGCAFVRGEEAHRSTFSIRPPYLARLPDEQMGDVNFADLGIELSRRFRALKVWMCLKEHGVRGFEGQIRQNVHQARYLAARVRSDPRLELVAPVPLNVVCFRYVGEGSDPAALDAINRAVLGHLRASGVAVPSHSIVDGRFVLRVAVTNHRSRREDFDLLLDEVVRLGVHFQQDAVRQRTPAEPTAPARRAVGL